MAQSQQRISPVLGYLARQVRRALGALALASLSATGCHKAQPDKAAPSSQAKPVEGAESADKNAPNSDLKYGLTAEQASQVLVEVGDTKITLGEFAERLGSQSPYVRARYHSPERRREFLENMVRFELLAKEAEKRGFTHNEEVERVRRQVMVQQMMQDLFDKGGLKLTDIRDDEVQRYYEQHPNEFNKPAQVRASHILFKDRAAAERCLKELQQKPGDMELFRKLARERSQDASTKNDAGDLRFFSLSATEGAADETHEPERAEAVRKAAFALNNIGDLAPEVVQSEQGFHVVKLTGKREPLKRSLDDARRMIQNKLWRQKREQAIEQFVADLRNKANVQENPDVLAKVQVKDGVGRGGPLSVNGASQPPKPAAPAKN